MIRIGLTGPIGCGKSTIASWLGELGAVVIDADLVARGVTPPGSPVLAAVVAAFGPEVLRPDGSLDRSALARIVFADASELRRLEAIIHPAVRQPILELIADAHRGGAPGVVVEAIKLVEGGLAALCDEVWLVICDPDDQRGRLIARSRARFADGDGVRGGADAQAAADTEAAIEADAEARIAAQSDLVARLRPHATRVIDTTGSLTHTRAQVFAAWKKALAAATAPGLEAASET